MNKQNDTQVKRIKLHSLQYLRAIAAIAVVYSHTVLQVEAYRPFLHHFGDFGVDIFFVISGFIMVYIAKPGDTPVRFMVNRIRRVVPLYWFFILLMAAILVLVPTLFKTSIFDIDALFKSLMFIPYFSLSEPDMIWPIVAPGWSLNYEMYFYLAFAISLLFRENLRLLVVCFIIIAVYIIASMGPATSAVANFYGHSIVFEFILGMLLAKAFKAGFQISSLTGYALIAAGFVLLLLDFQTTRIISFGIPSLMIVTGTLFCVSPESRFFVLLGDSSYALYLCHIFTLGVCRAVLPPLLGDGMTAAILFVLISVPVCIASGILVHFVIDNWLLKEERLTALKPSVKNFVQL